jgi:HicB family
MRKRLEPGGRVLVRMPRSLHAELVTLAEAEGVSLNQLAVTALARMAAGAPRKGCQQFLRRRRRLLTAHPQFVGWQDAAEETELRATMHWPGDEERLADLNVFFVHTPLAKRADQT